jgi:hypothetical protein
MAPDPPGVVSPPAASPEAGWKTTTATNGLGQRRARREAEDRGGPRPLSKKEARQLTKLRARRVNRIVRHVDPWAVLKLSLLFYLCLLAIAMVAGIVLWIVASATGTIHSVEGFVKEAFAFKTFHFDGVKVFRASLLGGLVLVIAGAGLNTLLCALFNLISDLIGGVRVAVIEEETARPSP